MKKLLGLFFGLTIFAQSLIASETKSLKTHFLNKIDEVIFIVKDKTLSKDDRNGKIVEVVSPMFDFELMAKLSLGKKKWRSLGKADRAKFVSLYVNRMKKSYSSKLDTYSDEKIVVTDIKQTKKNKIQLTTDILSDNDKFNVVYKYYKQKLSKAKKDKDPWLIYDVEILGVSILKTDRAQFKEFLKNRSLNELMESLKS